MNPLRYLTLCSPCESTDVPRALALSRRAGQRLEWGLRLDARRAGSVPGFPSLGWAREFADACQAEAAPIALHLCPTSARALVHGTSPELSRMAAQVGRIQLEALPEAEPVSFVRKLRAHLEQTAPRTVLSVRASLRHPVLVRTLGGQSGLQVLLERPAGGRSWPALRGLEALKPGFRGELGPANLEPELHALAEHTRGEAFWVQLDEGVQGADGTVQLERCEDCVDQLLAFEQAAGLRAGAHWGEGVRSVGELSGWWLDWWVAAAQGLAPMVPPRQACSAVLLERRTGHFEAYRPTESLLEATRILGSHGILLEPSSCASRWTAWPRQAPLCRQSGASFVEAGLRAVVAWRFGARLPANPMLHEAFAAAPSTRAELSPG